MNDHTPRINAARRAAEELAAIEELERRTAPLIWMTYVAAFVAVLAIAVDGWDKYADMAAQNEALVQCINGKTFRLGDALLSCEVREYKLVEGMKS